jgi:hypothetical protein
MMFETETSRTGPIRERMKGAIVRALEKAKREPKAVERKRFPRAGGYVTLAQSGLMKIFKNDFGAIETPRLDVAAPAPGESVDLVKLVSFAINALGPASYRAGIQGVPVTIAVADEATAEVMRAAIRLSCKDRPTNRLIRITVKDAAPVN